MKVENSGPNYQGMEHAYQPICILDNWDVLGYEALLRFADESRNKNIEEIFVQARQEGNLYVLDTTSISEAICSFPFHRFNSGLLFVNIFPSTLLNDQFESFINQILIRYPQAKGRIVFEINETRYEEHIWEVQDLKEKIFFLKEKKFYIALDDIGKGAAALQKIIEFPADFIKIDRYFAKGLSTSMEKQELLFLLVEYSKQRMTLILEGIESEMDLAIAKSLQVPVAQGYLIGEPKKLGEQRLFGNYREPFNLEKLLNFR